jgi:hypothetical protein
MLWSPTRLAAVSCQELSPVSNQLVVVKLYWEPTLPATCPDILNEVSRTRSSFEKYWFLFNYPLKRV